ncbi:MAG: glycerol dehydrogenase [Thermoguttaceae bacterium]
MKLRTLLLPGKYIQGVGAWTQIVPEINSLGSAPTIIWDKCVADLFGNQLRAIFKSGNLNYIEAIFSGETVRAEAKQIADKVVAEKSDLVVGIGGGKTLDIAKAIACYSKTPLITVPTIASNDSPCSSFTVWYDRDGNADGFDSWGKCPNSVIVDSQIIASSPVRTFISGIGDALATWYEAEAAFKSRKGNCIGGLATTTALILARTCRDTILEYGIDAIRAVKNKTVSPALEKVLEATILHSGVGFESGGLATAHQMANNMSVFKECHGIMHGEEVAFGLLTQLCLDEDCSFEERNMIVDFLISVGLPVTFEDIKLHGVTRDKLKALGNICVLEGSFSHNHPFAVSADSIVDAMIMADALGTERKLMLGIT